MSVALDSSGTGTSGGVSGATNSQTTSATLASGAVLIVWVLRASSGTPPTITSVKWNTTESLTLLATETNSSVILDQYGLINPTSGSHDIVVTLSGNLGSSTMQTFWMSATGASTTAPFTSVHSDNRILAATTTVAGSLVTDCIFSNGSSLSASGTETMLNRDSVTTSQDMASGYQLVASPSTVNTSWSVSSGGDTGRFHTAVIIAPPVTNTGNFFLFR